ncbi:MAG: NAD(P)-dependent oxidoreductase, partial [Bacteroidota bacterium]
EEIGFGKYIISATTPFKKEDLEDLNKDADKVLSRIYPKYGEVYAALGWKMFSQMGRVYVNEKARRELGWKPKYDFGYVLDCLQEGKDFRSELALQVGIKKYHDQVFEDGPYPVNE